MTIQPNKKYTPSEYIALERNSETKSEFFNGEIFAMTGATERHNLITLNIAGGLWQQMKGRSCKTYSNDMRVKVSQTGLYTYPDVVGICDEPRFDDDHADTLLNPTVIFEVLSKTTEAYDRGEKFMHYRKIDSLKEYLLVSQNKRFVEHFFRQPDNNWLLFEKEGRASTLELKSINCRLSLAEVYDKVELETRNTLRG